ncbi:MAG: pilus assembly protein TadG-related protein [Dehalococcoidia bacterium]|nr:pilus assembly protein TadG-related protein [Dehalococcoidia bacterium]
MKRLLRRLREDHGQAIILFVMIISITLVIGVITIDFSLWFSERRGAQKDADLSALAAAQELLPIVTLDDPNATAIQQAANDRATEYANLNDVTDPANILLPSLADSQAWTACWSDEGDTSDIIDTYPLDIKHPTRGLFGEIFSIADQSNLGAHARACVGSVNRLDFVMPVGVPMNNPDYEKWIRDLCWSPDDDDPDNLPEPLYGKQCDLSVFDKVSGEASWMDLDHPDPEDYPPSDVCSEKGGGANELGDEI